MLETSILLETGIYDTLSPEKTTTIKELVEELNLEGKYFGILVNGKKASENTVITKNDKVVIIPHIAGGFKFKIRWLRKNNIYSLDLIENNDLIEEYELLLKNYKFVYYARFYEPIQWDETEIYEAIFIFVSKLEDINFNEIILEINQYVLNVKIFNFNITPITEISSIHIPVFEIKNKC